MAKYSAGINKNGFWLNELVTVAEMRLDGDDWAAIKSAMVDDNVLLISSRQRATQMYGVMNRRLSSLPMPIVDRIPTFDLDSQKIINLIAIMNTELLIKTFVVEQFRDELILGDSTIEPYEIQSFFDHLQATHEDVAQWTDQTIHRLSRTIKNYLKMAGLAVADGDNLIIQRPILSYELESLLHEEGYSEYVTALTGM
ncbi:DUF1819 family protein [Lacticaseibacillus hulanensis]|uniref:DUF1819 family protein n=1 Tax=Lacticaseibacillus hulanensis TaxID=2493111 RepID=UPI0013E30466|nr:DUF1819 family protein [Lacticaseibacillus hulanensis]